MLKAIGKTFLFRFKNDTYGGKFVERSQGQIILTNQDLSHQAKVARWVEVVAVGEEVESIKAGDVVEGTVKNVTDFGAFIDLGGADGLLHISEMSWGRVENPKKVFKVGDQVKVLIKSIDGKKIALSRKFDNENPWKDATEKYAVGNVVTGTVARMTDFGAFVELEPGIDALLHVSQIAKEHIDKPSDVLKVGQEVTAKIVDFNEDDKKISLSIKAMLAPDKADDQEDGDVVSVDIDQVISDQKNDQE